MSMSQAKKCGWRLVGLFLAIWLSGCPKVVKEVVKTPTVAVKAVDITGISSQSLELTLGLVIDNPNPIGITLSSLEYQLELAQRPVASGTSTAPIALQASGQSPASITLAVAYRQIDEIYRAAEGRDEIPYRLTGKVRLATPIGEIPIPFETKGLLPVVRPPAIEAVDLKVDSLSLAGAKLTLSLTLSNPNAFALTVKEFSYQLLLENRNFTSGALRDQTVAPKARGTFKLPVTLDFTAAGAWAYSLLTRGSAGYVLTYQATYLLNGRPLGQHEEKRGALDFGR